MRLHALAVRVPAGWNIGSRANQLQRQVVKTRTVGRTSFFCQPSLNPAISICHFSSQKAKLYPLRIRVFHLHIVNMEYAPPD
jgi:hypothetical protein